MFRPNGRSVTPLLIAVALLLGSLGLVRCNKNKRVVSKQYSTALPTGIINQFQTVVLKGEYNAETTGPMLWVFIQTVDSL